MADVPELDEPPPHAEMPMVAANRSKTAVKVTPRLRFLLNGSRNRRPANTDPRLRLRSSAAVWVVSVAMVTVKLAALPPAIVRLVGVKLHEAFAGKLLHVNARVPE